MLLEVVAAVLLLPIAVFLVQYLRGYLKKRLVAWGKDTYIRFYPNPGVGVAVKDTCYMLSVHRGYEVMKKNEIGAWYRIKQRWGRV
ncbi:MAG: hypothetical protein QXX19_06565 [Candidatus Caldarchaeum sp.]